MAEVISFLTNSLTIIVLVAYLFALWAALVLWTWFDISERSESPLYMLGAVLLVATGSILGFAIYLLLRPSSTKDEIQTRRIEEAILSSQAQLHTCPECFTVIKEEYSFCSNCATRLVSKCQSCSRSVNISWRTCPYCGAKQTAFLEQPVKRSEVVAKPADEKQARTTAILSSIFGYLNKVKYERGNSKSKKTVVRKAKKSLRTARKRKS